MLLLSETFWFSLDSVSLTFICVAGYSCSLYFSHCCIIVHFVSKKAKTKVKVLFVQLCLNLCDPVDFSSLGSYIRGTSQVGSLEWVTIPFSRDLPDPGIEPTSPMLQADSLLSESPGLSKTSVGKVSTFTNINGVGRSWITLKWKEVYCSSPAVTCN